MPMRGPKPPAITLTEVERQELQRLIKRHTTPQQLALRARLILAAADGLNNAQVAHREALSVDSARHWRTRWLESRSVALTELSVKERLADAPRSGKPPTITDEQVCQIVALACDARVKDVCALYREAPILSMRGERVVSTAEPTGLQTLQRRPPDLPLAP